MENNPLESFQRKNEMVIAGQIIEAVEKFFGPFVKTIDFDGTIIEDKETRLEKSRAFIASIEKVNDITLHYAAVGNDVSFAEFTFDFDMKDGSKTYWHEIIRSVWKDGLIVEEQYFKG
jgi:hypothetical protein